MRRRLRNTTRSDTTKRPRSFRMGRSWGRCPARIESMGRGALTLYLDTVENAEVAGDAAIPFTGNLTEKMAFILAMSAAEQDEWRAKAAQRVRERYSWEAVTSQYETMLAGLC